MNFALLQGVGVCQSEFFIIPLFSADKARCYADIDCEGDIADANRAAGILQTMTAVGDEVEECSLR